MEGDDTLTVTSKAFEDGASIPTRYSCDGDDVSPPLSVGEVPDPTQALALVMDDPDAPGGTFTHWLVWNVPADTTQFPEDIPKRGRAGPLDDAPQGSNDFGNAGYGGPCPPQGDGAHRYRFTLYALDAELDLSPGSNRGQLDDALEGHVLATGQLVGTYER